jgi:ATPase family AAA domain-containing protein 2
MPEDEAAAFGVAATRSRRTHHQPQQSYESYGVPGGGGDDVYQPEQSGGIQPQQQTTTRYRASTSVSNGTIDPAVITTKEESVEIAVTQRGRVIRKKNLIESSDEEEETGPNTSRRVSRRGNEDFIAPENDDDEEIDLGDDPFGQPRLGRLTRAKATQLTNQRAPDTKSRRRKDGRNHKRSSRKRTKEGSEDDYVDEDDDDESLLDEEDLRQTSPSLPPTEDDQDDGDAGGPKTYGFRSRHGQPTNYNEIAAFEKMEQNGAATRKKSKPKKAKMNWTGKDYETAWGPLPGQSDSDSDRGQTPRKPGMGMLGTPGDGGMLAGGAGLPLDVAGTPSNLGRIGQDGAFLEYLYGGLGAYATCSIGLADADPLGVNVNVSFDDVGGLDERE